MIMFMYIILVFVIYLSHLFFIPFSCFFSVLFRIEFFVLFCLVFLQFHLSPLDLAITLCSVTLVVTLGFKYASLTYHSLISGDYTTLHIV